MTPSIPTAPVGLAARISRLETRVALALGLLVTGALVVVLLVTTSLVSSQSRAQARFELGVARESFQNLLEERAAASARAAALVTQLPVFRAHLTDARLAADRDTVTVMAEGYRGELQAQFAIVARQHGEWTASPGWQGPPAAPGTPLASAIAGAQAGRASNVIVGVGPTLYLVVSVPARFADEILGTLTMGFALSDDLADRLARLAGCEVMLLVNGTTAASSLDGTAAMAAALSPVIAGPATSSDSGVVTAGGRRFLAAVFPMAHPGLDAAEGRLVLLSDLQPTERYLARLRAQFAWTGLAVLVLSLAGGVAFSRRVSRPLRDVAAAATEIAAGNLGRTLPEEGPIESVAVARAFNDMSASLLAARERLIHDATHDLLTQLPNRVLFMERLERAMLRRVRHSDYRFAVLFIDLDRFKHVNDSLGHRVGDELLLRFADRLAGAVRRDDVISRLSSAAEGDASTLARFGGDEFVVLLDDLRDPIDAVRVAERIRSLSGQALRVGGHEVFTTPSIGVAVAAATHRAAEDLVRDADAAMYRAKAGGGNSYAVFDAAMHDDAVRRLRLETELRGALDRGEFRVYYQPIVALHDRQVVGFEALIRWQHPERGLLAPAAFLPVADEIGLITQLDAFVLFEAARQCAAWHRAAGDRTPPSVSVNLSAKSFALPDMPANVAGVLSATGLPPQALRIEITESTAIVDPARASRVMTDIRALGVRVSIDDFGTGYSSLSYLQQFPVDVLKIDRSFVVALEPGGQSEIVQLIVGLARALGLDVVAEGTETEAQIDYLHALGCGHAQGYYFGRPAPAEEVWPAPARA